MKPEDKIVITEYWTEATQKLDRAHPDLIGKVSSIKTIGIGFTAESQQFTFFINGQAQEPDLEFVYHPFLYYFTTLYLYLYFATYHCC